MATVPTVSQLSLSTDVKTTPDRTPVEGPNVELAAAAGNLAAKQSSSISGQAFKTSSLLSTAVTEAQNKARKRTDKIHRTREFNTFGQELSDDFSAFTREDLTDPDVLEAFNKKVKNKIETFTQAHRGSKESLGILQVLLENKGNKIIGQAGDKVDTEQQAIVDQEFGDNISGIVASIASGRITLDDALIEVDKLGAEYEDVSGPIRTFEKIEVAQEMVIIGTLERFVDTGQLDAAEKLINGHPEVLQTLDAEKVGEIVRNIEQQKTAKRNEIAKRNVDRQNILQAAGVTDPKELSAPLRMLYYTGKMGEPEKDNRTNKQKDAEALTNAENQFGKDSAEYRNLHQVMFPPQLSEAEKLIKRQKWLRDNAPDSQELQIVDGQLAKLDPEELKKTKLREDFPQAQTHMISLRQESTMLMKKIDEALILATGAPNINEALKLAAKKDADAWATGNIGIVAGVLSGESDAAELEAALMPIRSNTVLKTMEKMRAQSSSGATGLGAMSDPERIMLRDAQGSLNARVPGQLLSTLLMMREKLPLEFARQEELFNKTYSSLLGGNVGKSSNPGGNVSQRGDGKLPASKTGAQVIKLNQFENDDEEGKKQR